jgi:hypothetical protein
MRPSTLRRLDAIIALIAAATDPRRTMKTCTLGSALFGILLATSPARAAGTGSCAGTGCDGQAGD